jgi:flagellar basal body-associated protein FliL
VEVNIKVAKDKKENEKGLPIVAIVIAIIVIVAVIFGIVKLVGNSETTEDGTPVNQYAAKAKKADDIKINDSDSNEVKIEKIQGKLELVNKEIDEKQKKLDVEYEKINSLYEEYVSIMNEYQTGSPVAVDNSTVVENTETETVE